LLFPGHLFKAKYATGLEQHLKAILGLVQISKRSRNLSLISKNTLLLVIENLQYFNVRNPNDGATSSSSSLDTRDTVFKPQALLRRSILKTL
jgi:hypothetical protein